jgi:hypothetical protein
LHAILLWTLHHFPDFGIVSFFKTQGSKACLMYSLNIMKSHQSLALKKDIYMGNGNTYFMSTDYVIHVTTEIMDIKVLDRFQIRKDQLCKFWLDQFQIVQDKKLDKNVLA